MSAEAGVGIPFVIVCPACETTQSAENASIIINKCLIEDIGYDKLKWTKCQSCTKNIAILIKSVKYRVLVS